MNYTRVEADIASSFVPYNAALQHWDDYIRSQQPPSWADGRHSQSPWAIAYHVGTPLHCLAMLHGIQTQGLSLLLQVLLSCLSIALRHVNRHSRGEQLPAWADGERGDGLVEDAPHAQLAPAVAVPHDNEAAATWKWSEVRRMRETTRGKRERRERERV